MSISGQIHECITYTMRASTSERGQFDNLVWKKQIDVSISWVVGGEEGEIGGKDAPGTMERASLLSFPLYRRSSRAFVIDRFHRHAIKK